MPTLPRINNSQSHKAQDLFRSSKNPLRMVFGLLSQVFHDRLGIWRALRRCQQDPRRPSRRLSRSSFAYSYNAGSAGLVDGTLRAVLIGITKLPLLPARPASPPPPHPARRLLPAARSQLSHHYTGPLTHPLTLCML